MASDRSFLTLSGVAAGALGSVLAAAGLVGVRRQVGNVNVALVLVLFVVLGASIGGRVAGVVSALVAAISFDFFHTLPYNSLKIARASDIVTTGLLLFMGLVVGEIAARWNRLRPRVKDDLSQVRRLHRVAELAAGGEAPGDLILAVTAELISTLGLRECRFERPPFSSELPCLERNGTFAGTLHHYAPGGFELPPEGLELRVIGAGRTVGRFVLEPTPGTGVSVERRLVAVALADQVGVALAGATA